jgi:hypothetical protein
VTLVTGSVIVTALVEISAESLRSVLNFCLIPMRVDILRVTVKGMQPFLIIDRLLPNDLMISSTLSDFLT